MRIRMRTGLSGPDYSLIPGDERDFPDKEAIRLIEAGYAVPVASVEVETTALEPEAETREAEAFGGKGDHDGNGKVGGAKRAKRATR